MKLENPTVKDLVEYLLKLEQSKLIIISDPDTGWDITKIHISEDDGRIEMTGQYHEMKY